MDKIASTLIAIDSISVKDVAPIYLVAGKVPTISTQFDCDVPIGEGKKRGRIGRQYQVRGIGTQITLYGGQDCDDNARLLHIIKNTMRTL